MHKESGKKKKSRRNYLFPGNYNSLVALLWGLLFCLEFLYNFSNFYCYMHYLVAYFIHVCVNHSGLLYCSW